MGVVIVHTHSNYMHHAGIAWSLCKGHSANYSLLEEEEFHYVSEYDLFLTAEECGQVFTVKCWHVLLQDIAKRKLVSRITIQ